MIPERLIQTLGRLYTRVTEEPFTVRMAAFVRHLSWVTLGYAVAKFLTILVNIFAGRWLGPSEYGLYGLTMSIGTFSLPVMLWGLPVALVRFGAGRDEPTRRELYGTGISLFLVLGGTLALLLGVFSRYLSGLLDMEAVVFRDGIIYGTCVGVFTLLASIQQAEGEFRERSVAETMFGAFGLGLFILFFSFLSRGYRSLTFGLATSCLITAGWIYFRHARLLKPRLSFEVVKHVIPYGVLWKADALGHAIQLYFLRFVVNNFLSSREVGVLSAYTMSSIIASFYMVSVFVTVFFPSASAHEDRTVLWDKVLKLAKGGTLPLFGIFALSQLAALWFFGKDYPLRIDYVLILGVTSVLTLVQSTLAWLMISEGVKAYRRAVFIRYLSGAMMVGLGLWWVPRFGLTGAVYTYFATYLLSLLLTLRCRGLLLTQKV